MLERLAFSPDIADHIDGIDDQGKRVDDDDRQQPVAENAALRSSLHTHPQPQHHGKPGQVSDSQKADESSGRKNGCLEEATEHQGGQDHLPLRARPIKKTGDKVDAEQEHHPGNPGSGHVQDRTRKSKHFLDFTNIRGLRSRGKRVPLISGRLPPVKSPTSRFPLSLLAGVFLLAGCSSAPKVEETTSEEPATQLYFPPDSGEWERIDPVSAGWDPEALEALLDYAEKQRSSGVVILLQGRILAERYWEVETPPDVVDYSALIAGRDESGQVIEDVMSIQKSVIAFLAGVAERKGLLDIEQPASKYLGQGWSQATPEQEAQIKVRNLMSMASGLDEDLAYMGTPGELYMYNTPAYSRTVTVLERATGMDVNEYTSQWLTSLTGMEDSRWWTRPGEVMSPWANVIGFVTTARDLARFGLLMQARGSWAGEDLLQNPDYFERMLSPSTVVNPSYGFFWWLNGGARWVMGRQNTEAREGALVPPAPDDLFAGLGALGRKVYVVPSLGIVFTRLGDEPHEEAFSNELWKRLMKAVPK